MEKVSVTASAVTRGLTGITLGLLALSTISVTIYESLGYDSNTARKLMKLFYVDLELNAPAFYSSLLLLFVALLTGLIFYLHRSGPVSQGTIPWMVLAAGFMLMSFDELIAGHERLIEPMREALGAEQLGVFYFAWVVPAMILVVALGLYFRRFLYELPSLTRRRFILAGLIFLTGAIGVEMLGARHTEIHGKENAIYLAFTTIEESLEMFGVIYFIRALIIYLSEEFPVVALHFGVGLPLSSPTNSSNVVSGGRSTPRWAALQSRSIGRYRPLHPGEYSIEIIDNDIAFRNLRGEWNTLLKESGCSPFLTWEWMSTWFSMFGQRGKPWIMKAYRNNELIGILPLYGKTWKVLGSSIKKLSFIGEKLGGADHLEIIARTENRSEIVRACLDYIFEQDKTYDILELENIDVDSPIAEMMEEHGKSEDRLSFAVTSGYVCPKLDLTVGWDSILKKSSRGDNFKRKYRQLAKLQGFEHHSITDASEVEPAFERFIHLHNKRWSGYGESELSGSAEIAEFHRRTLKTLAETGLVRFEELWVNGQCVASVYGFDNGRTFSYFNSGYEPEWSKHSVGLVLLGLIIKSAAERGLEIFDFLRGEDSYKFDWADRIDQMVNVRLVNDKISARLYVGITEGISRLKDGSKVILPDAVVENIRKWRRKTRNRPRPAVAKVNGTREIYGQ